MIVAARQQTLIVLEKQRKADDHDCLHMLTNFDSLRKVKKADDHDCLYMTTDFDSLEKVKKTVIVLTKDIEVFEI